MSRVFLYGAMTGLPAGVSAQVEGFAIPDDGGCFPMAVARAGAVLTGSYVAAHPAWETLFHAFGAVAEPISDSAVIYILPDAALGDWDIAAWADRWGEIAPLALREALERAISDSPEGVARAMHMILTRAAAQVAARTPKPAEIRSDQPHDSVQVIEEKAPHKGYFLTRQYQLRHPRFDGSLTPPVAREVFVATDAAIILPYDPARDRVLLVEQFRMGPFGRGDARPWMLEPVAGRVDGGETPEATARRECLEEAGLVLTGVEHIASHYCSPGCSTEYFHCYLGLTDLPQITQGQGGLATEHEDIRTHVLPYDDAARLIDTGEADNGPLILMLLWLGRERARLRAGA